MYTCFTTVNEAQ